MYLSPLSLLDAMTDEDLLAIHNAGQLKSLCFAIALDLATKPDKDLLN